MLVILNKENKLPSAEDMIPRKMYMPTVEQLAGRIYMNVDEGKVLTFDPEMDCPDSVDPKVYDYMKYVYERTRGLLGVIDDLIEKSGEFTSRDISEAWRLKFDPEDDVLRVRSRFVPLLENMLSERMLTVEGTVKPRGYTANLYVRGQNYEDVRGLLQVLDARGRTFA